VVALSQKAVGAVEMTPSAEARRLHRPLKNNVVQLDGGLRPYQ